MSEHVRLAAAVKEEPVLKHWGDEALEGGAILSAEIYVRHFVSIISGWVLSADWSPAAC